MCTHHNITATLANFVLFSHNNNNNIVPSNNTTTKVWLCWQWCLKILLRLFIRSNYGDNNNNKVLTSLNLCKQIREHSPITHTASQETSSLSCVGLRIYFGRHSAVHITYIYIVHVRILLEIGPPVPAVLSHLRVCYTKIPVPPSSSSVPQIRFFFGYA